MNKKERQEINEIRKRMHYLTGDDAVRYIHYSEITEWLWRVAHRKNRWERLIYKLKSLLKRRG